VGDSVGKTSVGETKSLLLGYVCRAKPLISKDMKRRPARPKLRSD